MFHVDVLLMGAARQADERHEYRMYTTAIEYKRVPATPPHTQDGTDTPNGWHTDTLSMNTLNLYHVALRVDV